MLLEDQDEVVAEATDAALQPGLRLVHATEEVPSRSYISLLVDGRDRGPEVMPPMSVKFGQGEDILSPEAAAATSPELREARNTLYTHIKFGAGEATPDLEPTTMEHIVDTLFLDH